MGDTCWLTIVGLGEDGPKGLSPASLQALESAEVIMAPLRHLALVPDTQAETIPWPVPFSDGLPILQRLKGRPTVVLASGDPFWFGAGTVIAKQLPSDEWRAFPGPSSFALAAARLGWPLERTICFGLHAAPLARLRPHLATGQHVITTLRDGNAARDLAAYLTQQGWGDTELAILESLGGPRERCRRQVARDYALDDVTHPIVAAFVVVGQGAALAAASGQSDEVFDHDGQITKRPVRALTLSALAPKAGEHLWDIGAGSGSISIEWLLSHPMTSATAVELNPERAARIQRNAASLGQDRLTIVTGAAPDVLSSLPKPDVVFVGGGLDPRLLEWLWANLAPGTRIVANAVTLDSQALLTHAQAEHGGALMKIDLAEAAPLGRFQGWKAAYTLIQWSVVR